MKSPYLNEVDLIRIRDAARNGEVPTTDVVEQLVDQARQLDYINCSQHAQTLKDINVLLKRILAGDEDESPALKASVKRCSQYLDEVDGTRIKYRAGWPSMHIKW